LLRGATGTDQKAARSREIFADRNFNAPTIDEGSVILQIK
jgi:hypothetical protein